MRVIKSSGDPHPIRGHVFATYVSLRWGLVILAVLFPLALYAIGKWGYGLDLQPSMSAYYFAADQSMCATFPMRTIFVGMLCAICAALYLYKGFGTLENYLLNAAAFFGAVVAVVPENLDEHQVKVCEGLKILADAQVGRFPLHYTAAVLMFVCLAIVAWRCACETLAVLPPQHKHLEARFRATYKIIGVLMLGFPLLGIVLNYMLAAKSDVFFVEAAGIWTFAAYWFVKSKEMALSKAEFRALKGEVMTEGDAPPGGQGVMQPVV
jgi:cytochrome b561